MRINVRKGKRSNVDRDAIIKALRKFTDIYNDTVDKPGQSNSRSVWKQGALRKARIISSKIDKQT